jgi:F-type H+-transporting ATPase subunit delta
MEELIAKRYINALKQTTDTASLEAISGVFDAVASAFKDAKFNQIMNSSDVSADKKEALLLEAVKTAGSEQVNNLVKLLVEKGRIAIIPTLASELKKEIARMQKSYTGAVYSNSDVDAQTIEGLAAGLGKRVDATIALDFVKSDFDGIKVQVADLGIEINFSRSRMNKQLVEFISKAI